MKRKLLSTTKKKPSSARSGNPALRAKTPRKLSTKERPLARWMTVVLMLSVASVGSLLIWADIQQHNHPTFTGLTLAVLGACLTLTFVSWLLTVLFLQHSNARNRGRKVVLAVLAMALALTTLGTALGGVISNKKDATVPAKPADASMSQKEVDDLVANGKSPLVIDENGDASIKSPDEVAKDSAKLKANNPPPAK